MTAAETLGGSIKAPPIDPPPQKKVLPRVLIPLFVLLGAFTVWKLFYSQPPLPDSIVALSGRIEGDDSAISAKTSGRMLEIHFREGDTVKAGDIIAVLDDQQVREREDQARAAVAQSEAQLRSAQDQIAVLDQQLSQTRLESGQATIDAQGRVNQAQAELAAAEADLAQQRASLELALFDKDAYTRLAKTGAVSERQGKQAETTAASQQAVVAASERRVEAARGSLNVAKANLSNPAIRNAQSAAIRKQLLEQQAVIANSRADANRVRAQLAEAESNRGDLIVRAPFAGTVITRSAEPGEYLQAGTAIVTLLDLTKVYLRAATSHKGKSAESPLVNRPASISIRIPPHPSPRKSRASIRKRPSLPKILTFVTIASNRWWASSFA